LRRHSPPCTLPPSRGAPPLASIASQLTTANAAIEKGKLRRTAPTAEEIPGLETTIGQLLSPSDQHDPPVGIVSQADVLSIFSPSDEEIRREVTDRMIPQGLLMDPDRLQVTARDGIVTLSGRAENDQVGTDIIEAVRHIEGAVAAWGPAGPWRRATCTRPHPDHACFTSL
jgi:hypothetical protein